MAQNNRAAARERRLVVAGTAVPLEWRAYSTAETSTKAGEYGRGDNQAQRDPAGCTLSLRMG
jgi:hypothetical protein